MLGGTRAGQLAASGLHRTTADSDFTAINADDCDPPASRMAEAMETDESAHPVNTGALGAKTAVDAAQSFGLWVHQASRTRWKRGAGQRGFIYCRGSQCPRFKPRRAASG